MFRGALRAAKRGVLPHSLLRMRLHMQHTRAKKFWPGSTIHSPFEGFEAVDLSFRLTITPWLFDRVSYGVNIPAQCAGEALHCIEARLLCVLQPDSKLAAVFASQNAAEPHGESSHFSEVRQFAFERVNLRRLSACQRSARLDAQRRSDDRRDQSPRLFVLPVAIDHGKDKLQWLPLSARETCLQV